MKYAIVECGGKQYKAVEGSTIEVDLLAEDPGKKLTLEQVLLLVDGETVSVGTPNVKKCQCESNHRGAHQRPQTGRFQVSPQETHPRENRASSAVYPVED